jgi:hypothetical protein
LISNNWLNTGITGTVGSLAGVPTIRITGDSLAGAEHIAEAAGAASILLISLGAEFPSPASPFLICGGALLGVGDIAFLTTLGILEMVSKDPEEVTDPGQVIEIPEVTIVGQPSPDPNMIQVPEVTIYGSIPSGLNPQDVDNAPTIDPNDLPQVPPEPPPDDPDRKVTATIYESDSKPSCRNWVRGATEPQAGLSIHSYRPGVHLLVGESGL